MTATCWIGTAASMAIATTEVGADLCCCPECEAEVEAKAEREAERRMDEEYERARGFYKPDSPD